MSAKRYLTRGFTLVEILVVISITVIISSVLMVQYSKFDSQLLLRNLAFEVALEIRDAQVRGISVRGEASNFTAAYGVHFAKGESTYLLFRDTNNNGRWDGAVETLSTHTIGRGNRIGDLCYEETRCDDGDPNSLNAVDILFERPDPDAIFYTTPATIPSWVGIEVHSAKDTIAARSVVVSTTGQISIR